MPVDDNTTLGELSRMLDSEGITFTHARLYPRGWTVELRTPKGIVEASRQPSMATAVEECMRQWREAPSRANAVREPVPPPPQVQAPPPVSRTYQAPPSPPVHMRTMLQRFSSTHEGTVPRSLCNAVSGVSGRYAESEAGVTCMRCQRAMKNGATGGR